MYRSSLLTLAPLALAVVFAVSGSRPEPAGAPWMSLEFPANPLDPATAGAALVIHTFYHEYPTTFDVSGTAYGLVNGERRTVDLEFRKTSKAGVIALEQTWPADGDWVLAITSSGADDLSLIIELGPDGGIRQDSYYDTPFKQVSLRSARLVRGTVDPADVDAALMSMSVETRQP